MSGTVRRSSFTLKWARDSAETALVAVTVAARGCPSMTAISPK
jgi:hypothetical protein